MDPYFQVVGQVFFTNKAIQEGLNAIHSSRWIKINYEDLCNSPISIWEKISALMNINGYQLEKKYNGPLKFECMNKLKLAKSAKDGIYRAYHLLEQEYMEQNIKSHIE
jgi:hypothetical protein